MNPSLRVDHSVLHYDAAVIVGGGGEFEFAVRPDSQLDEIAAGRGFDNMFTRRGGGGGGE